MVGLSDPAAGFEDLEAEDEGLPEAPVDDSQRDLRSEEEEEGSRLFEEGLGLSPAMLCGLACLSLSPQFSL